jgi:NAD(P)H-hydrate epimerase
VAPGRFHAGRVRAIDIGIPAQADGEVGQGLATPALLGVVPPKPRWASKHEVGRVLCVGGSAGMSGAIALCATATLRGGAGVVWAAVPERLAATLDGAHLEVQVRGMIADAEGRLTVAAAERLEEMVMRCDVVAFGPGAGRGEQVSALARWTARTAPALVLDADGLNAFAADLGTLASRDGSPTLLTPHEGELARLLDVPAEQVRARRLEHAREAASRSRATVLLKGEDTIVCDPSGEFVVCRSSAAMATAGSGDVLAGACAALMGRGLTPLVAGSCAATACGIAAELAAEDYSMSGVVASDIIEHLPAAIAGHRLEVSNA